jgi:hypothetical protein
MHASLRREVQSKLSGRGGIAHRSLSAQAQEPGGQDLSDLGQALLGAQQIGRYGVGACKAVIEFVASNVAVRAHPAAARSRYSVSL